MRDSSETTPAAGQVEVNIHTQQGTIFDAIQWLDGHGWLVAETCTMQLLLCAASPDHCALTLGPEWEKAHEDAKAFVKQCIRQAAIAAPQGVDAEGLAKRFLAFMKPAQEGGF